MDFGQLVKQLRIERGISQDVAAKHLGYAHRAQMVHLENGDRPWRLESVQKIAKLFGMEPSELLKRFENQ